MREALGAARNPEQRHVFRLAPVPAQVHGEESGVERLAVHLLGVRDRAVDVEDQRLQRHVGFSLLLEHPAGADVLGRDGHQCLARERRAAPLEQSLRLAQTRPVERVADRARIGEVRPRLAQFDVLAQCRLAAGIEPVFHVLQHQPGDRQQLALVVIRKVDVVRDARGHARIGGEEPVHPVLVAGEYDDQVLALVFHHLQQDFDRFLAVVALVLGPVEVIGLVDEQHAAHGALEHFLGLGRGVADVLPHQVVARDRDQVPFPRIAERVQDFGHAQGDGGLAGSGVAGEAHVQRGRARLQPDRAAQLVDHQQRGDFAHARLHRHQADELALERLERARDVRVAVQLLQVERQALGRRHQ